tara:strand:+ start:31 stop:1203 length:1173 start_codon:yes stop_codon:yes gene_type:complete
MNIFNKFFNKFAYKFDKGYPDMNNDQDVLLLESLISEVVGEKINIKEANLSGRTTNYSQPTGGFYKYVELNNDSDSVDFETERDAPIFDKESFEILDNISKGETFKILDNKESDLTKKGNSYYTNINYKGKEYYIRLSDILKPSGKQVSLIDVNIDDKTKDNVFNNFKAGHGQEKDIVKLWIEKSGKNYEFNYQGKTYEVERVGAPTFKGKGNPKTDVFVKLDKPIIPYGNDLKISLKAANATFVENWMLPLRFKQILGLEDSKKIILDFLQKLQKEEIGTRSPYMFWFIKSKPYNSSYELTREQEYEAYSGANKFGPDSEATANCYFKGNVPNTIDDFISDLRPISELDADIGLHLRGYAKGGNAACYLLQEDGKWEINPIWKEIFKIK